MGIEAKNLTRQFGSKTAVSGLSFQLEQGEVLGFIGPNGAGKTTTMRMLCGIIAPSSGTVLVDGIDPVLEPVKAKQHIGYLPENAPLYADMKVTSFLKWCGVMRGLSGKELKNAMERVMEQCSLHQVADEEIEALSKGYRRRVCLAQAIIHRPPVLIMDEPTDGLDPNQKREIRSLIRQMREHAAIIVSTHILEEIDAVCDKVLTICAGQEVFSGSVPEFLNVSGTSMERSFELLTGKEPSL